VTAAAEPTTHQLLEVAARVCTDRELVAVVRYEQGLSYRRIAAELGVAPVTISGRIDSALRKIRRELSE
jgi:DNA-directed RNA polymerase specialized sigma24 family protein